MIKNITTIILLTSIIILLVQCSSKPFIAKECSEIPGSSGLFTCKKP